MENKEKFGRFGAIMAMAGSAVGLGNMWRFPYLLGEHGGAAFLFVYLLFALLIALPLFLCEFIVGRRGGANCRGAYEK
ncbi:MAG: sodium-dependent transporter, partial [Bacteroidales bacterium]|nr:sodium-dependent transporter [Bacteroidales bacterium]